MHSRARATGKGKQTPESASTRQPSTRQPTPPHHILQLQRTYGNRAVQRFLGAIIQRQSGGTARLHVKDFKVNETDQIIINKDDVYDIHGKITFDPSQISEIIVKFSDTKVTPLGWTIDGDQIEFTVSTDKSLENIRYIQIMVDTGGASGASGGGGATNTGTGASGGSGAAPPANTTTGGTNAGAAASGGTQTSDPASEIEQKLKDGAREAAINKLKKEIEARHPHALGRLDVVDEAEDAQLLELALLLRKYSVEDCKDSVDVRGEFKEKVREALGL